MRNLKYLTFSFDGATGALVSYTLSYIASYTVALFGRNESTTKVTRVTRKTLSKF